MIKLFKSFSARLSLRFMFVMTGTVLVIIFSFLLFSRSLAFKGQTMGLKRAEETVFIAFEDLSHKGHINGGSLGNLPEVPYFMTYIIYDTESKNLLATNDPFLPLLKDSGGKALKYFEKDYFFDGDLNILYFAKTHIDEYGEFVVAVAQNMDHNPNDDIFRKLPLALLCLSLPILILSYFISFFITKRTIKPVMKITKAAQSITLENLSDLLPLSGYNDEIDELSKTFNELFQRLKRDFDRERQFSSDVSHELNTPLTVISGQAGLLLRWGKNDPKQLEKSLNAIKTEAATMHAIIENLLQISRIESGRIKPNIAKVELKPLFSWLVEEFSAVAPKMKIDAICDNISLSTDSEMLHQILTVLISNSVKYAGDDCHVTLKAFSKKGNVIIEQSDDGPGFSKESLPHIFERFYRADEAHSRKVSGSGLGLAIAQTLCTALNAKISARNIDPHGACFMIQF